MSPVEKLTVKLDLTHLNIQAYLGQLRTVVGGGTVEIAWDGSYWHVSSTRLRSRGNADTLEKAIELMLDVPDDWRFKDEA